VAHLWPIVVRGGERPASLRVQIRRRRFVAFAFLAKLKVVETHRPDLVTVSQAAEALGATSQSIRNWIRSDRLQAVRIGNRFLIPRADVERMLGDLGSPAGEGPWEFGPDDAAPSLPRVVDRQAASDSAGKSLGG
jgi:excisionase family DNA binding protein